MTDWQQAGRRVEWMDEFRRGIASALYTRNPSMLAADWGGAVGAVWMTASVLRPIAITSATECSV